MKPFYKRWFAKFAKVSESRSDNSATQRPNVRSQGHSFNCLSTPLENSFLHMLFLGLLASAATLLVWQIDLPLLLRALFLGIFLFRIGRDFYSVLSEKNLANFVQLSVVEHKWAGVLKNQNKLALQLLGVSSVPGLGFVLTVKVKSSDKIHYLMIWNTRAAPGFLRYCRQILKFGVPAE